MGGGEKPASGSGFRGRQKGCILRRVPMWRGVTPAKYKSITVEQIEKAIIATSLNTPTESDVYHYPEMMALNR